MKRLLAFVFTIGFVTATPVLAQDDAVEAAPELQILDAVDVDLNDFLWVSRPIIIFADSPADPRVAQQLALLEDRPVPLFERDVVVILDDDRRDDTEIRESLRPRGFMLVIMGKDGEVELRKPAPWDVREITRTIDKMPLRQQEVRAGG